VTKDHPWKELPIQFNELAFYGMAGHGLVTAI
jgi:hypothetical protein